MAAELVSVDFGDNPVVDWIDSDNSVADLIGSASNPVDLDLIHQSGGQTSPVHRRVVVPKDAMH